MNEKEMTYDEFKSTLESISPKEREIVMIFYLKDIKDLLIDIRDGTYNLIDK